MLIQGSTIIYSKKVEYLYTLLYQTLDFLIEKRKRKKGNDDGALPIEDGGAADDVEDEFREEEAEFLTLDDMAEANNIDLDESSGTIRYIPMAILMQLTLAFGFTINAFAM